MPKITIRKCEICEEDIKSGTDLNKHYYIIHGCCISLQKIECKSCETVFDHVLKLKQHLSTQHRDQPICFKFKTGWRCVACQEHFTSENKLDEHLNSKHENARMVHMGLWVERTCGVCNGVYETNSALISHLQTHNKKKLCGYCTKRFAGVQDLNRHLTIHSIPRVTKQTWECKPCNKTFAEARSKRSHLNSRRHRRAVIQKMLNDTANDVADDAEDDC